MRSLLLQRLTSKIRRDGLWNTDSSQQLIGGGICNRNSHRAFEDDVGDVGGYGFPQRIRPLQPQALGLTTIKTESLTGTCKVPPG
jgi:hypothetical protein